MIEKSAPVLKAIGKYIEHREGEKLTSERLAEIEKEFTEGFKFLSKYPKSVTFFGSNKSKEDNFYYTQARELASRLVKEAGYSIFSGGGPGIMEAADRGAQEAGGESIGLLIRLPNNQPINKYLSESMSFYYLFARKFCLAFGAEVFVFFPGGFGTLDEFFEIITLAQTKKISGVPILCYGSEYWNKVKDLMQNEMLAHGMIDPQDLGVFTITDDLDEIVRIAKSVEIRAETALDLS